MDSFTNFPPRFSTFIPYLKHAKLSILTIVEAIFDGWTLCRGDEREESGFLLNALVVKNGKKWYI